MAEVCFEGTIKKQIMLIKSKGYGMFIVTRGLDRHELQS